MGDGREGKENGRGKAAAPAVSLVAGYRPLDGVPDEMVDAAGDAAPGLEAAASTRSTSLGPRSSTRRFARADQYLRDAGVYYRVYDKAGANEREWPLAHVPLLIDETRMGRRSAPAWSSAPNCSRRSSPTSMATTGWSRDGLLPPGLIASSPEYPAAVVGVKPAERPFPAFLRLRARPRPGRQLVGAGRPHAGAVGRRLRAGEPRRHDARAVRHLWRDACPSARRLLPPLPRRAASAWPPSRRAASPS